MPPKKKVRATSKATRVRSTASRPTRSSTTAHLSLNLHREFFDDIACGEKTVEYRSATPYWEARLVGKRYDEIHFRNGYSPRAPFMRVECKGIRRISRTDEPYFAISLGRILQFKNYRHR